MSDLDLALESLKLLEERCRVTGSESGVEICRGLSKAFTRLAAINVELVNAHNLLNRDGARLQDELKALKESWPISQDGPHTITEPRRWLARQLMDSKLSAVEAFGIVAHHPSIKAQTK